MFYIRVLMFLLLGLFLVFLMWIYDMVSNKNYKGFIGETKHLLIRTNSIIVLFKNKIFKQ